MSIDHDDDDIDTAADADAEANYLPDPFSLALELCRIAAKPATYAAAVKKLRKVGRDILVAEKKLAAVQAEAAGIVDAAQAEVKAMQEAAAQRLDVAATVEHELVEREQKIARLENAWRNLGEPETVLRGFQSPQFSPLQKARMGHGLPPGKDPDLLFSEPDAPPPMRIDALSDTSDDPHADRQGAPFLGELTRDVAHKFERKGN
jgi:hypothetical protein